MSGKNHELANGDWDEVGGRIKMKKVHPKELRGVFEDGLSPKDARKENRDLRKRLARRQRRNEKQRWNTDSQGENDV